MNVVAINLKREGKYVATIYHQRMLIKTLTLIMEFLLILYFTLREWDVQDGWDSINTEFCCINFRFM
jgi:hypothetical protein